MTIAATRPAEQTALLAAIAHEPDDDTPRLVYADWLEEYGKAARAEFIRVQCELARVKVHPMGHTVLSVHGRWEIDEKMRCKRRDCAVCPLRARDKQLRDQHEAEWRCPRVCAICERDTCNRIGKKRNPIPRCSQCNDTGRVGVLGARDPIPDLETIAKGGWKIPVDWVRGFPRISCPAAWWCEKRGTRKCPQCANGGMVKGEWTAAGLRCSMCFGARSVPDYPNARRAWAEQGMLTLRLSDVQPDESYGSLHEFFDKRSFDWCHPKYFDQGILPKPLFLEMCKLYPSRMADTKREYHPCARLEFATEADARAAADHTAAAWARGLATGATF